MLLGDKSKSIAIDGVPVGVGGEAVRAGNIDRRQLPEVERLYQENVLKNMAVVLNGSSLKPAYGYGYTDPKARHHHHRHKKKSLWKRLLEKLKK